jgi:hypothetical protein
MKIERAKTLELLGRRLELVRALVRVGAEWQRAFIGWKLDLSERCASEEIRLCDQIRVLDVEMAALEAASLPALSDPLEMDRSTARKIRDARDRMRALQLELKRSNEIRRCILKRSKITLNALENLYNSHAPTYAAPTAHATGTLYEERV